MTSTVTVRHNFETAHRLPHLPGKCESLHGHSWWATVTIGGPEPLGPDGIVADFGRLKADLRDWLDTHVDHGSMLGHRDPLAWLLRRERCKVFVFGEPDSEHALDLEWPTVENTARLLARVMHVRMAPWAPHLRVLRVDVQETAVNTGSWVNPG